MQSLQSCEILMFQDLSPMSCLLEANGAEGIDIYHVVCLALSPTFKLHDPIAVWRWIVQETMLGHGEGTGEPCQSIVQKINFVRLHIFVLPVGHP